VSFFLLLSFGKKDEMQLLAEFKNIMYIRFRTTLNFRKFKVALNPTHRIFVNFAKSYILSCLSNFDIKKKNFTEPFLKYKRLKLKLRVFLAGYSFAMVTYWVTKMILPCSPVIGHFSDTIVVASIDKEW